MRGYLLLNLISLGLFLPLNHCPNEELDLFKDLNLNVILVHTNPKHTMKVGKKKKGTNPSFCNYHSIVSCPCLVGSREVS